MGDEENDIAFNQEIVLLIAEYYQPEDIYTHQAILDSVKRITEMEENDDLPDEIVGTVDDLVGMSESEEEFDEDDFDNETMIADIDIIREEVL